MSGSTNSDARLSRCNATAKMSSSGEHSTFTSQHIASGGCRAMDGVEHLDPFHPNGGGAHNNG